MILQHLARGTKLMNPGPAEDSPVAAVRHRMKYAPVGAGRLSKENKRAMF
jgi:hypothetical protein